MNIRQFCGFACALAALATTSLPAHDDHEHPVPRVREDETYRPLAIPDRIILTWTGDPATTQAVTWRTDETVRRGLAEIAVAEDGPQFVRRAGQHEAQSTSLTTDLGPARYHTVNFEDLEPRTKYVYRVGDGTNWSEWSHFRTASDQAEPFTFVYFGDAQNDVKSMWSRVVRESFTDAPKAAFTLHAGDLVNRANRDAEWGEWFYAGGFINRMVPCIATPGNHEYERQEDAEGRTRGRALARHWQPSFAFPLNGPQGLEETTWWIDYQGTRIISLNSNTRQEEQAAWVEAVLADNPHPWTIITFHHPLFSSGKDRDNPELRAAWQPVFDKHRVDLVLQGHDHTYARSGLVGHQNVATGVGARSPDGGTVYVVSVSGPKMYRVDRKPIMVRVAEDTQLYQIIRVDGGELHYEARTATGRLYDAFTLRKRDGQPNALVERVPEAPENLREAAEEADGD